MSSKKIWNLNPFLKYNLLRPGVSIEHQRVTAFRAVGRGFGFFFSFKSEKDRVERRVFEIAAIGLESENK